MTGDPTLLFRRELPDGRALEVRRMLFQVRLCIGPADELVYDDGWCVADRAAAIATAETWDGNGECPAPWHKHLGTGRWREIGPDGEVLAEGEDGKYHARGVER